MVIDTSAIVALLFGEPEAQTFAELIEADPARLISSASVLEAAIMVASEFGGQGERELDLLLQKAAVEIAPFTADQLAAARFAYDTYGKGRHPAALNLGDCFSYALSRTTGEPLLYKGQDSRGPM
jgi:ribonuclease VapC